MYNKHSIGYIGEMKAATWFSELGWQVFFPAFHQGPIDFIMTKDKEIKRVQVKVGYWMTRPSGCRYLQATTRYGVGTKREANYTKDDCDLLVIVADEGMWVIPIEEFPPLRTVNLLKSQKYRASRKGVFDADNYKVK